MKTPGNVRQAGRKSISNAPLNGKINKKKPSRLSLPDTSKLKQGLVQEFKSKTFLSSDKSSKHSPQANASKKSTSSPEVKLGLEIEALLENASQSGRKNDAKKQEKLDNVSFSNKSTPKKTRFSVSTSELKNSPKVEKSTKKRPPFVVSDINVEKLCSPLPNVSRTGVTVGTTPGDGKIKESNKIKLTPPQIKRTEEAVQVEQRSVSPANPNIKTSGKKKNRRHRSRSSNNANATSNGNEGFIASVSEEGNQTSGKMSISPKKVKEEVGVSVGPVLTTPEQKSKAIFRKTPFPAKKEKIAVDEVKSANIPQGKPSEPEISGGSKSEEGILGSSKMSKNKKRKLKRKALLEMKQKTTTTKKQTTTTSTVGSGYLDKDKVLDAVRALLKLDALNVASDKALFSGLPRKVSVQINSIKIADTPQFFIRIPLAHAVVPDVADICLFVKDLKGKRREPDLAVDHYTELLRKFNINCINKVIALQQLSTDYAEFELKRKLACSHDKFLVDSRICNRILPAIGKHFFEKNKIPTPVSLSDKKIKESIKKGLSKCLIQVIGKGNSFFTEIGHTDLKENELTENILKLAYGLDKLFPGGWKNIRSLQIKTEKTKLLPLYMSMISPNKVPKPIVENIRKLPAPVRDELSTIPNADVVVYPSGKVRVRKRKSDSDDEDETQSAQEKIEDEGSASAEDEDEVDDEDDESGDEVEDEDGVVPKKKRVDEGSSSEGEDEEEDESDLEGSEEEDGFSSEEDEEEEVRLKAKKSSSLSAKKTRGKKPKIVNDNDESSSEEEIKMAEEDYLETLHAKSLPVKKVNKNKTNLPSKPVVVKGKIAKGKGPLTGKKKKK